MNQPSNTPSGSSSRWWGKLRRGLSGEVLAVACCVVGVFATLLFLGWGGGGEEAADLAAFRDSASAASSASRRSDRRMGSTDAADSEYSAFSSPRSSSERSARSGEQSVYMAVFSYPMGARVLVDGVSAGTTPLGAHRSTEGSHTLVVKKEGYAPVDTVVSIRRGQEPIFSFPLRSAEASASPAAEASRAASARSSEEETSGRERQNRRGDRRSGSSAEDPSGSAQEREDVSQQRRTGTVRISSEPSGARVVLGGEVMGRTPQLLTMPAGPREVVMQHDGYEDYRTQVAVQPGQQTSVQAQLRAFGQLEVLAQPWGTIYVDGVLRASEADTRYTTRLPAGAHTVRVEHPALGSWRKTVEIEAGQARSVAVDLSTEGSKLGQLEIQVQPWGTIYVDGVLRASEADTRYTTRLPAGAHTVRVEHPALGSWRKTVEIEAGQARSITVNMEAKR